MACVIEKNYAIFRNVVGEDFHPLEVVFELGNPDALFWKKVLSDHLAQGILFGFGRKNSLHYVWKHHYQGKDPKVGEYFQQVHWESSTKKQIPYQKVSSSNFTIPRFGCIEKDKFVKKYRKERKKILKIYQGKDLVDVTLTQLMSD